MLRHHQPVKKGNATAQTRPADGLGRSPGAIAEIARLRADNSLWLLCFAGLSGLLLSLLVNHWAPAFWSLAMILVLLIERRFAKGMLAEIERGGQPDIAPYAAWTFSQAFLGSLIAPIAWFFELRHGDALAVFALAIAAANAVLTLRRSSLLLICALVPLALTATLIPLTDFFLVSGGRTMTDLAPLVGMAVSAAFAIHCLQILQEGDKASVRAEEATHRAQAAIKQAANARHDFVVAMKHETRTPMTALNGAVAALRGVSLPPEARLQVEAIADAAGVLAAAMDDLAETDAHEAARPVIQPRPTDVAALVRGVAAAFRTQAEAKGLEIIVDIAEGVPREAMLDALRVRQILFNLVSNAVKYTQAGGVRIRLQAQAADAPSRTRLRIAVADTGVGMSRTELAMLMSNPKGAAARKSPGLATSARLAGMMGARLGAKSVPGEGTMFSLLLETDMVEAPAPTAPSGHSFLVIAHLSSERRAIAGILEATRVRYEVAETSALAIEMLHAKRFDLILADQRLPEFDAMDIAELLREGGPNAATPVIALCPDQGAAQMCRESGVDGAVLLPIAPVALLEEIARVMVVDPSAEIQAA